MQVLEMQVLDSKSGRFEQDLSRLLSRDTESEANVDAAVSEIIEAVRTEGDKALLALTNRYDQVQVGSMAELLLTPAQIDARCREVSDNVKDAINTAAGRIRRYHEKEPNQSWQYRENNGTVLGQQITPLERAGIYVPGGKASYPSSVLMTAIPARVAGVREVIMVAPAPRGEMNPAVIYAAATAGVDRIFTIGGAQAVAALAYGTETVPAVDKIVGPGNIYVATAKKQVFGKVGIDMIAGPSEVVVICDQSSNPDWVAMDLFAQAEHDELAQSIAITDSEQMTQEIQASVERLLPQMERGEIIKKALAQQGAVINAGSVDQAVRIANRIAPEHLELMVEQPEQWLSKIQNAGAIFMGRYSAESLGDYCAGPNHVLPTAGTARFSSPLGVYDFQKRSSIIYASKQGASEMAATASVLARCEGLTAHARSAEYRMNHE